VKRILSTALACIGCLLGIIALVLMLREAASPAYLISASGGGSCTPNSITWGTQPASPIVISGSTQNLSGDATATSGGTITYSSSNANAFTISGTTLTPTATAGNVCQTGYVEANSAATGNYCAANQLPSNLVTVYPAAPTGVSAGSPTTTSFQVTFTCGSGAASCNIDYATAAYYTGNGNSYNSNTGTVTSPATVSGLSSGTTYHFRVNSVASCGTTNGSDNTEATSAGAGIAPDGAAVVLNVNGVSGQDSLGPITVNAGDRVIITCDSSNTVTDDLSNTYTKDHTFGDSGGAHTAVYSYYYSASGTRTLTLSTGGSATAQAFSGTATSSYIGVSADSLTIGTTGSFDWYMNAPGSNWGSGSLIISAWATAGGAVFTSPNPLAYCTALTMGGNYYGYFGLGYYVTTSSGTGEAEISVTSTNGVQLRGGVVEYK
jgi:hypothetical protein